MSDQVVNGSVVTFHYTLTIPSENHVADSSREGEPATVTIGSGELIEGLESRMLGLQKGDTRKFEVPCMEAYGPAEQERILTIPLDEFPEDMDTSEGNVIGFTTPSGEEIAGVILANSEGQVRVDFSHPLAGYDLLFDIEILNVEPA
ncbi:MAG: FKBP-type peptidyl-prolyl cis-trans isomerase [Gammaproteobacteria bacterium]|nr:FKBP-type peptidyl-prolyl cis-trans isomerase [Gammaproteobacteria bacterium]